MNKLIEIACKLALALILLSFPAIGTAQDITVAQGIACDTQAQVQSFASKWNGTNAAEALEAVNAEDGNKPDSCVITTFVFTEVETVNPRFMANKVPCRIVAVELIALPHPVYSDKWIDVSDQHVVWFTAIPIKNERGA